MRTRNDSDTETMYLDAIELCSVIQFEQYKLEIISFQDFNRANRASRGTAQHNDEKLFWPLSREYTKRKYRETLCKQGLIKEGEKFPPFISFDIVKNHLFCDRVTDPVSNRKLSLNRKACTNYSSTEMVLLTQQQATCAQEVSEIRA